MNLNRTLRACLFALALGTCMPGPLQACPNCKDAVAEGNAENSQRLSNGYSHSILLMMGMPLTLVAAGLVT